MTVLKPLTFFFSFYVTFSVGESTGGSVHENTSGPNLWATSCFVQYFALWIQILKYKSHRSDSLAIDYFIEGYL
jgi:hypothetical protein